MNQNIKNIIGSVRAVFVKSAEEREIQASIRELRNYSDAALNDIGISRFRIEECVRGEAANSDRKVA